MKRWLDCLKSEEWWMMQIFVINRDSRFIHNTKIALLSAIFWQQIFYPNTHSPSTTSANSVSSSIPAFSIKHLL